MPNFVHIDIGADEPERCIEFYSSVFGWRADKLDGPYPYWLIATGGKGDTGESIGAGVGKREQDWQKVTATIDVDSADDYAEKIKAEGGTIIVPKTLVPGVGYLVTFKDTEDNVMAILEPLPQGIVNQPPPAT